MVPAGENKSSVHLTLEGDFREPVRGVSRFSLLICPDRDASAGQSKAPGVGSFLRAIPVMEGVVELLEHEFDTLMTLVVAGRLAACAIDFVTPRYGKADIRCIAFSTDLGIVDPE